MVFIVTADRLSSYISGGDWKLSIYIDFNFKTFMVFIVTADRLFGF